jgi:hypothetical protein
MDARALADWLVYLGQFQGTGFLLFLIVAYWKWKKYHAERTEAFWHIYNLKSEVKKWRDLYVATLDFKDPRYKFHPKPNESRLVLWDVRPPPEGDGPWHGTPEQEATFRYRAHLQEYLDKGFPTSEAEALAEDSRRMGLATDPRPRPMRAPSDDGQQQPGRGRVRP